jgi:hypothetical protein
MSSLAAAQNLQAGNWDTKSSLSLNGIPLPPHEGSECITKDQTKNIKETITKELKKSDCTLDKWNLKGENLQASLSCKKKELEAKGTLKGKVTAKNYDLTGDAEGTYMQIPSQATLKLTGNWTGTCTK